MEVNGRGNETELEILRQQLCEVTAERNDYRDRFEKLATHVTRRNNPAIEELPDPIRPHILVDAFEELSSNEWDDAYKTLKNDGRDLEDISTTLFNLLKSCFDCSMKEADLIRTNLVQVVVQKRRRPPSEMISEMEWLYIDNDHLEVENTHKQLHISDTMQSILRKTKEEAEIESAAMEFLKCNGMHSSKTISLKICNKVLRKRKYKRCKELETYVEKCAELCWLMRIQVPPIMLDCTIHQDEAFVGKFQVKYDETGNTISLSNLANHAV